jgi:squalene-hopene/tetraprenyl-beta-curcumene cyclase
VKRPHVQPGGWAFQYDNAFYPDLDDTAMVIMALEKVRGLDADPARTAKDAGSAGSSGMQGADGGWGSFDADNNRLYLNHIPFADHGALLDPSTEDLTGRGLELLGTLGYQKDFEPAQRAIDFLRHAQRHDGPWYGRWGVNYIYGRGRCCAGSPPSGSIPRHEYVQRAVRLARAPPEQDGGWGETCESYEDYEFAGVGESIAEPDRVGAPGPLRGRAHERPGRRARRRTICCARSATTARGRTPSGTGTASRGSSI